jgi:hypothetical protein
VLQHSSTWRHVTAASSQLLKCALPAAVVCVPHSTSGVKKQVNENQNMWGMLTAESFTPFLEFDFLGADAWAALGETEAELAGMQPGDKLKARAKQVGGLVSLS